ncbi:MAG: autotransporter outer membrane beta-barrel domain-containing protein [Planctomycetia bacterium]|nr:autotransporter outer membrane beta-barrel domain-containing protein [Planctomycetia bacterium]
MREKNSRFWKPAIAFAAFLAVFIWNISLDAETIITINAPSYREGYAPESTLAPTRDFMITGTISGSNASEVANLTFNLYKMENGEKTGDPIRVVKTDTYTANPAQNLYKEFDQVTNTRIESKAQQQANLLAHPMPDLVYDASLDNETDRIKSQFDPTNKAVLIENSSRFSAIILGGATKDFFTNYGVYDNEGKLIKYEDIAAGKYALEIAAYDNTGNQITEAKVQNSQGKEITDTGLELTYAPSNIIFSRYTSKEHEAKFSALANAPANDTDKYKIMKDFFPGYWTDYNRYGTFGEALGRWEENDWIEYEYAPKTLGMIYDINSSCATLNEIYRVIKCGHLESGAEQDASTGKYKLKNQTYLYHYDWGDESLSYTRRDGSVANVSGNLILFKGSVDPNKINMNTEYNTEAEALENANNKYSRLDLTRVDLYGSDADPESVQENRDRINDVKKQVSLVNTYTSPNSVPNSPRSLILVKTDQSIGLHGVLAPLNIPAENIETVETKTIGLYPGNAPTEYVDVSVKEYKVAEANDPWIKSVDYTLKNAKNQQIAAGSAAPGLLRTMSDGWSSGSPSLFEFKALLDEDLFTEEGIYTLSLSGSSKDGTVERTDQTVDILITRTGIYSAANKKLTPNQQAVGDAMLDMLIENNSASPELSESYRNAPENEALPMLSQLSGSQLVSSISKLAFNPLTTSMNRLDTIHNDWNDCCSTAACRDFWATYIYHGQNTHGTDEIDSFKVSGNGLAVGYDRAFNYARLGAAFVYEDSSDQGNFGENELDDMSAVAYGKFNLNGKLWFNGMFGYSWRNYKTDRINQWTNFSERLTGDFSGNGIWANFRLEREVLLPNGLLIPFVGYEANWNNFNAYEETGGSSALSFEKRSEDYGFLQAGARTDLRGEIFDLGFRAMYVHRVAGPDRAEYTAALTGKDQFQYRFNGLGVLNSTDFCDLNLDLRFRLSEWTNLFTGYNGLYGNRSSGHMLTAGLNTQW